MAFTPKDWKDSPDHTTPLSAAALEDLETRVTDYADDTKASVASLPGGLLQPKLKASGMVPVSGATMPLAALYPTTAGDIGVMSRFQVPIGDDVHLFAPVFAGWGLQQGTEPGSSFTLIYETDTPATVTVSASVETLDGRLYRLSVNGSRRWTIAPGAQVQCDPVDVDVKATDTYFFLRVYASVPTGSVMWRNHHCITSRSGEKVVRYAVDPTLDYATAILALTPSLYWKLNAADLAADKSGNGRDGTANSGITIGRSTGFASDGGTFFDDFNDNITSAYNPFTNAQPLSIVGWAYRGTAGTADTLFGSDAAATQPNMRVNANGLSVQFLPAVGGTAAVWTTTWPASQWVHWALVFDEAADTAELWINGVSQGTQTTATPFNASPGNFKVGAYGTFVNPWDGNMSHVAVFANVKLTNAQIGALYNAGVATSADQTNATGALVTTGASGSGSDYGFAPVALLGTVKPTVRKPIVAVWGDSIAQGLQNTDTTASWADIALQAAQIPYLKVAKGTEKGSTQTTQTRIARRLSLADGATHAIYAHGVNDYRDTTSDPVLQAVYALLNCQRLVDRGMTTYATTLTPGATSSDSWATTGNQTVQALEVIRSGYNDWLRAGAPCASTTLTGAQALTAGTLNVGDTSKMPNAGRAVIAGVPIAYTGKTSTTLTGCTGCATNEGLPQPTAASIPGGTKVLVPLGFATTAVNGSITLPTATIPVLTTVDFASSGIVYIGGQAVTYTGKTGTTFTGCSGGTGGVNTYHCVQAITVPASPLVSGDTGHPLTGYIEIADAAESARNSGKWKVTGAAGYATADGIHPSAAMHTLMAVPLAAKLADGVSFALPA